MKTSTPGKHLSLFCKATQVFIGFRESGTYREKGCRFDVDLSSRIATEYRMVEKPPETNQEWKRALRGTFPGTTKSYTDNLVTELGGNAAFARLMQECGTLTKLPVVRKRVAIQHLLHLMIPEKIWG